VIEKYENEHYAIDSTDPMETIKFRMEQLGFKQKYLENTIALKSRVTKY
jgi:HTH-type transcriptional regulator/antitoxin HigA